ncbi:hypothetical protein [Treponema denticola]
MTHSLNSLVFFALLAVS